MKRLRLWLKELSLTQQLIAIVVLVIGIFAVFSSLFMVPSVQTFTETEMYHMLHYTHQCTAYYLEEDQETVPYQDDRTSGIIQGIYDLDTGQLTSFGTAEFEEQSLAAIAAQAAQATTEISDYTVTIPAEKHFAEDVVILFCQSRISDHEVLVSCIPSAYEQQFRGLLLNDVVNNNTFVVMILFVLLLLWVASLIHPLNQIRTYITRIKNEENAELNVNRRDEIGQVADALVDMQAELKKQNQEKQEMIQNISHDLKTPIATIKSYCESIKDGIYPYGTLEKSIDVIYEHASRLEKKVQSLISLNKMGYLLDVTPEGDHLNMNEVIDHVLLSLKVIRPEISFDCDLQPDVYFHGEEDPWRTVVENLVDNSLRYAEHTIWIRLKPEELIIGNDGRPIDPGTMDKMFRPYEKGSDGQFGLGLSIVHKVVTTYGYKVEAANLAKGVQFRIYREHSRHEKRQKEKKNRPAEAGRKD